VAARLARELVQRCRQLTQQIKAVEAELRRLKRRLAPSLRALAQLRSGGDGC
jgi:transposase